MSQKQYAAFAANIKSWDALRQKKTNFVPGVLRVEKVILLSKSDFDKLSEDISPDYPFLQDNRRLLSAEPGGLFRCLMVRAEGQAEHLLISQRRNTLYLGYGKDYRKVDLKGVPVERLVLEDPKVYQERAVFHHRPHRMEDIMGEHPGTTAPERQTGFRVEQVVVLTDEQYRQFQESGLVEDQIFLFDYNDKMWFDPGDLCWHCVLVKGETSRDGVLVEAEGYSYARYAAFAPDCSRLRLRDAPVHYEYPAKAPEQVKTRKRNEPER